MKIVKNKINENCHFYTRKNRCLLHGRVFVMRRGGSSDQNTDYGQVSRSRFKQCFISLKI